MAGYAGKVGWGVGIDSWLDNPASKVNRYWRAVEYGGRSQDGLILIGLWGNRAGTNVRPNMLREGQSLTAAGAGAGQKFVPFGTTNSQGTALKRARFAFWYFITHGNMGRPTDGDLAILHGSSPRDNRRIFFWMMTRAPVSSIPFVSARAVRPTLAHHYYRDAVASFRPVQVQLQLLAEMIGPMIQGAMTGHYTPTRARAQLATDSGTYPRTGRLSQEVTQAQINGVMAKQAGLNHSAGRHPGGTSFPGAIATYAATSNVQDLIRTGRGTFPAGQWQAALIDVNREMARLFQIHLVSMMQRGSNLRPPTHELIEATMDPRNRHPR